MTDEILAYEMIAASVICLILVIVNTLILNSWRKKE